MSFQLDKQIEVLQASFRSGMSCPEQFVYLKWSGI